MLYRIYTENKNQPEIEKIAGKFFDGFTVIKSKGFWRLQGENSLILEIEAPDVEKEKVEELAKAIKEANAQESVLIQELKNSSWLV